VAAGQRAHVAGIGRQAVGAEADDRRDRDGEQKDQQQRRGQSTLQSRVAARPLLEPRGRLQDPDRVNAR